MIDVSPGIEGSNRSASRLVLAHRPQRMAIAPARAMAHSSLSPLFVRWENDEVHMRPLGGRCLGWCGLDPAEPRPQSGEQRPVERPPNTVCHADASRLLLEILLPAADLVVPVHGHLLAPGVRYLPNTLYCN
jgi:hypothetical protein